MTDSRGNPTFSYVNEEAVDSELKCPICYDPLWVPAVCQDCRNTFCRPCVETLTKCPMCRGCVHPLQEPPRLLTALLGKLLVKCNLCSAEVKRGDFSHHVTHTCPIPCRWGCGAKLTRYSEMEHRNVCPQQIVVCNANDVGCVFKAPRLSVESHQQSCPYFQLRHLLHAQQSKIRELELKLSQRQQAERPKLLPLTIKITSNHNETLSRNKNSRCRRRSFSDETTDSTEEIVSQEEEYGVENLLLPQIPPSILPPGKKRHKS